MMDLGLVLRILLRPSMPCDVTYRGVIFSACAEVVGEMVAYRIYR